MRERREVGYICVTACIIAQLTRASIEPFQPNNPSGHLTYIYSTIGQVMSCAVFKHKHIHRAFSTQQSQWKYAFVCVLYFRTHLLNTYVCIHVLYIPGTYMHNRAHWYISILMQYFISQLQQHCVVKGCDPSRSVCLGRRIPAKLVKVRIDYCSALSYLIFRFLPRLVSPLGPG